MSVSLTSQFTTSGTLEVLGTGYSQPFTINANSTLKLDIPNQYKLGGIDQLEQKVVYVSTEQDITAYAYNEDFRSSDGTMVLPVESLDKEYIITAYKRFVGNGNNWKSQFIVLGVTDDTEVEITFAEEVEADGQVLFEKGQTITRTLNRGEVILYQSVNDLTGTQVKVTDDGTVNCKKIAVFAGNDEFGTNSSFAGNSTDHTFSQLYAVRDWGKEYFVLLHETRFLPEPVVIVAAEDNTRLEITSVPPQTLNKGEIFPFFAEVEHYITADKPISVTHYTSSAGDDRSERGDNIADPFMMVLSPLKQTSNDMVFNIFESETIQQHYLSIVTSTQRLDMRLDGENIADQFAPMDLAEQYSLAIIPISPGAHRLQSNSGAIAHAYGFGEEEGIGYAIGGDLGQFDIDIRNVNSGLPTGQVCANEDFELSVTAENQVLNELYTNFEWDMGDGTILVGPEVTYRYSTPGNYNITLSASKSELSCSDLNVSRNMEVMGAAIESIAGPQVVCPNVENVSYELTGSEPDYDYQWFIEGGTIVNSDGPNANVLWQSGSGDKTLKVISVSPIGCMSDTVRLSVEFKPELEPIRPIGPSSVCGDYTGIAYHVPATQGSIYTWRTSTGQVVSGQGTSSVLIDWDGPGTHHLSYKEISTTQTDYCEGFSPSLLVIVSEEMDIEIQTQSVSCFGAFDGAASVSVTGSVGPFSIEWSTGSTQNNLSGLGGGSYEVMVTDGVGCTVTREVVIEEPEELSGMVEVVDPTCTGNNGTARALVTGGTGALSYNWGNDFISNNLRTGIGEGTYSVRVRDETGCELVLNYSIREPQPMVATVEQQRPCPNVSEGSLALNVEGGTLPYTYHWDHDGTLSSDMAENLTGGAYRVLVVDAEGCTLEITEELVNLSPRITMPNAFSPNGDDDNDRFEAVFTCEVNFQMYIYNQWGNLIFASNSIDNGWDGTYKGEEAPPGEYAYHIVYDAGPNGEFVESVRGQVMLIR